MQDIIAIVARVTIMYLVALLLLRISGKRTIGELSALDFVTALIIGDLFDDVILAEVPVAQGLLGMGVIVLLAVLVAFAEYKSDWIHRLVNSTPSLVMKDGRWQQKGMDREHDNEQELMSNLREKGISHLAEVGEAQIELSGDLSVQKADWAEAAQKQDLPALQKRQRSRGRGK